MHYHDDIYVFIWAGTDYIRPNSYLSDYILKMDDSAILTKVWTHCWTDKCFVFPSRHSPSELKVRFRHDPPRLAILPGTVSSVVLWQVTKSDKKFKTDSDRVHLAFVPLCKQKSDES